MAIAAIVISVLSMPISIWTICTARRNIRKSNELTRRLQKRG